ncbi:MAG: hypothetical protein CBE43_00920 [Rhodopirellula sp. TMED283]|nr:MAG: hypothetical protein CBE43_00920 [Rhodopirellula sp. TMED283]
MSRAGDSPPEGPRDGDAFAVFAAFAPFARRILEIDPDLLVDQAAELDDDAFAGFAALTTLLIDARQEPAEHNEPAQAFAACTGEASDVDQDSEGASTSAAGEELPAPQAWTFALGDLLNQEEEVFDLDAVFEDDDDEDRSLSRATTPRQRHLWYTLGDSGAVRFLGNYPFDWWNRHWRPRPTEFVSDYYLQPVVNGHRFCIAFTEATWTTSNDELNPWSRHAARGLYNAYPRLFDEAASTDVLSYNDH